MFYLDSPPLHPEGELPKLCQWKLPINNPVVFVEKTCSAKKAQVSEDYLDHRSDFLLKMSISPDFGAG